MATKFQVITSTGNTMGSKYQKVIGKFCPACADCNECSECIGELEPDLCYTIFRVMDRQTIGWWEKNIAEMKLKEQSPRPPQKGKTPPKPKRPVVIEVRVQCKDCGLQETVELEDWHLVSRIKFLQDDLCGEVVHRCPDGYGAVFVTSTNETVGQYIKRKRGKK